MHNRPDALNVAVILGKAKQQAGTFCMGSGDFFLVSYTTYFSFVHND